MSTKDVLDEGADIEQYLQDVADRLRPFKAWEKVGDGTYLLLAATEVSVGKKMTRELLALGYAVESCHNNTLKVREIDLAGGELKFRREQPVEDDGLRADGSGQRALFPPTDPGKQPTPATVYVVVGNYADDPHPHVEAVYDNEAAAEKHKREIRDSIKPSSPVAWGAREVEVQEEVSDLDY